MILVYAMKKNEGYVCNIVQSCGAALFPSAPAPTLQKFPKAINETFIVTIFLSKMKKSLAWTEQ